MHGAHRIYPPVLGKIHPNIVER